MQINWQKFKTFVTDKSLSIHYVEFDDVYYMKASDGEFSFETNLSKSMDIDDVSDFETNFKPSGNIPRSTKVTTAFEENDKRLKCASGVGTYDINGDISVTIKVPTGGRWIAGGSAFTDAFYPGDIVTAIQLTDEDDLLGYGAGTVLASYEDNEADVGQIGWYFEPDSNNTGFIEIEPIGGYAFLPEGMYLKIIAKKELASTATKVFLNIWWGKVE